MGDRYSTTKVSDSCWDAGLRKVDSAQHRERITHIRKQSTRACSRPTLDVHLPRLRRLCPICGLCFHWAAEGGSRPSILEMTVFLHRSCRQTLCTPVGKRCAIPPKQSPNQRPNFRLADHSDVEGELPLFLLKPRSELKPTTRERVVFPGGNDCALMIENAPALRRSLPNGRATGHTLNLPQRVS
jgi:hypothetical protein